MSEAGNKSSGFTLLETLVVVAIMALIGAIIVPNMISALDVLSLQQSTRLLQADLRVARATALRTGQKVDMETTNHGHEYDWIGGSRFLPPGMAMSMAHPMIVYPDGSVDSSPITMATRHRKFALAVDGATGAVTVSGQ
jgi:prepilin-type N-terminal cleavage/methylation domain-containing protein